MVLEPLDPNDLKLPAIQKLVIEVPKKPAETLSIYSFGENRAVERETFSFMADYIARKMETLAVMIIDDWLEDRVLERKFAFAEPGETEDFAMFAGILRAEAVASGYSVEALEHACGGDVSTFVMSRQIPA